MSADSVMRVGRGYVAPINHGAVFVDMIFPLVDINGRTYAWLDDNPASVQIPPGSNTPFLLPVSAITHFEEVCTFEDYLADERHDDLGPNFIKLIWLAEQAGTGRLDVERFGDEPERVGAVSRSLRALGGRLSPPSVLRCIALMHLQLHDLETIINLSLQWGDALRECDRTEQRAEAISRAMPQSRPRKVDS